MDEQDPTAMRHMAVGQSDATPLPESPLGFESPSAGGNLALSDVHLAIAGSHASDFSLAHRLPSPFPCETAPGQGGKEPHVTGALSIRSGTLINPAVNREAMRNLSERKRFGFMV